MDDLLTLSELAEECRIPVATLRHWRTQGTGPKSFKLGRRVMYRRTDVDAWIEKQYQSATKSKA